MPASILYRVIGVLRVPLDDQVITRLADILDIDDLTPKKPTPGSRPARCACRP